MDYLTIFDIGGMYGFRKDNRNNRNLSGDFKSKFSERKIKQKNLEASRQFKEDLEEDNYQEEIHLQVNKKRAKYNKLNDPNSFQTSIKYMEIKDEDKIWIYS